MSDRELLELAAKAAGLSHTDGFDWITNELGFPWNPLTDDGDALRLAVKLGFLLDCQGPVVEAVNEFSTHYEAVDEANGHDANKALRKAITRAAATLAKGED